MNDCINDKIETMLKDKNVVKIMRKASKNFLNTLDIDTVYTCEINALWKAILNFDPSKNTKFTTYLYKGVFIECLKALKFHKKMDNFRHKLHENIQGKKNSSYILSEILDQLDSQEERLLILDKYSNLTIQEMADKRDYSRETVRKKIKAIYDKLAK